MRIYIDADACPVIDIAVRLATACSVECVLICDTSHEISRGGVRTIVVEKGADSADIRLANMISRGDIAVTQDYGLAALCLARGAVPVNQNGLVFTDSNIDELLYSRYVSKKIRNAGGRLKGPSKRRPEQDKAFAEALKKLLPEASYIKNNGGNIMDMKFYVCKHCGNIIAMVKNKGVPVVCCGEKMSELVPNTTDAAHEKHVPVYQREGEKVTVTVGSAAHPMLDEHYIEWIAVQTKSGNQRKLLKPGSEPKAVFLVPEDDEIEAVYAYCNLHGLWKA